MYLHHHIILQPPPEAQPGPSPTRQDLFRRLSTRDEGEETMYDETISVKPYNVHSICLAAPRV
jgi:hypothetical protein